MKKILFSLLSLTLVFTAVFSFAGCDYTKKEAHALNSESNGGLAVYSEGYIYFIAGAEDRSTSSTAEISGIYRATCDENKNITGTPELVTKLQAGFTKGSLYVFGEYVYFAAPSTAKSNTGEQNTSLTTFYRVKKDGTKLQKLYTNKDADAKDFEFTFYYVNEKELYLITYENKTIYSSLIGSKVKTKKIAEDAETIMFDGGNTDSDLTGYIYYTKTPDKKDAIQTGNKVFRILPSGKNVELISEGKNISLLEIKNDKIYYKIDKIMYYSDSKTLNTNNVLSYAEFTDFIILPEGGFAGITSSSMYYYNWSNGALDSKLILSSDVDFVTVNGSYIYYVNDSLLYRISYKASSPVAEKLSASTVDLEKGFSYPEIIGDTLYFLVAESSTDEDGVAKTIYHTSTIRLSNIQAEGNANALIG